METEHHRVIRAMERIKNPIKWRHWHLAPFLDYCQMRMEGSGTVRSSINDLEILYNPAWTATLTDAQLDSVLWHELKMAFSVMAARGDVINMSDLHSIIEILESEHRVKCEDVDKDRCAWCGKGIKRPGEYCLSCCPQCGGPADNGIDRAYPPVPYYCTKCAD
jgi:hypothetical protein